jgi:hypothetical protein
LSRLRLLLLPPAAVFALTAIALELQERAWLRTATPEQISDDAATALLGWWPAVLAGALLVLLQAVVVIPILRRARDGAAAASGSIACAVTVLATLLFYDSAVDRWGDTLAVMALGVGAPVLLQAGLTIVLLRRSASTTTPHGDMVS